MSTPGRANRVVVHELLVLIRSRCTRNSWSFPSGHTWASRPCRRKFCCSLKANEPGTFKGTHSREANALLLVHRSSRRAKTLSRAHLGEPTMSQSTTAVTRSKPMNQVPSNGTSGREANPGQDVLNSRKARRHEDFMLIDCRTRDHDVQRVQEQKSGRHEDFTMIDSRTRGRGAYC